MKRKKQIKLDFARLSGDTVRAIADSTVGHIQPEEPAPAPPPPAEAEAEEKKPFEGMYYPLGR